MFKIGRKIFVLALLLVISAQGIAASLSHVFCDQPASAEHASPGHSHGSDKSASPHQHNEGDYAADYAGHHLSCHQSSSGIPSMISIAFVDDLPVYQPSSFSSPRLFFPEQPQRPPRT